MELLVGKRVGLVFERRNMRATTEVIVREVQSDRVGCSYGPASEISWFERGTGALIRSGGSSGWRLMLPKAAA